MFSLCGKLFLSTMLLTVTAFLATALTYETPGDAPWWVLRALGVAAMVTAGLGLVAALRAIWLPSQ